MQFFVRVYETGSFSAAAKLLGVGQPAVSKAVAQLEEQLKTKLLLRSTRRLTATEAGQNFYENAVRTIEQADLALQSVRTEGKALTGRLRVSGTVTFMRLHVIPRLPAFIADHPQLEIDFLLEDRNVNLIEEGVDIALRMGRLANSGLTARRIGQSRRIVVGAPSYFALRGEPKTPTDLMEHSTIVYSQGEGGELMTFMSGLKTREVALRPKLRVSAVEGVRAAVLAGIGVAVTTEWVFTPELEDGSIVEILKDWRLPPLDLWAVLPGGRRLSPKAQAFLTFVEEQLRATLPQAHLA